MSDMAYHSSNIYSTERDPNLVNTKNANRLKHRQKGAVIRILAIFFLNHTLQGKNETKASSKETRCRLAYSKPPPSLKFEAQQLEQAYSQEQYQIRIRI